jgi:hypothetical protein
MDLFKKFLRESNSRFLINHTHYILIEKGFTHELYYILEEKKEKHNITKTFPCCGNFSAVIFIEILFGATSLRPTQAGCSEQNLKNISLKRTLRV